MAITVLILGESGTGKSASLRNLPPESTAIINILGKPLPFPGAAKFKNKIVSDKAPDIIGKMNQISEKRQAIKYLVVDDFQYLMANEYMASLLEKGTKDSEFMKYKSIGYNAWSVIRAAQNLRPDMVVFFLSHTETDANGRTRCKTVGRLLDEKITIEGMFTIVLNTHIKSDSASESEKYFFATKNNGTNTSKSPMGMFENMLIDNDMNTVAQTINNYYGG